MSNGEPLRFGLVGAGMIAQTYAQAFRQTAHARLVAVADVRKEAADALGAALGCPSFACCREMADRVRLDAVVVCTPPATHPELCVWFAGRGIHVLCEKPLAIDLDDAHRMFEVAQRNGVELTMASKFRYVEDVNLAKGFITAGVIGDVVLFENSFTGRVDMTSRWNSDPELSGGGVLIDNGTHSVDIMRFFLGPLTALKSVEGKRLQSLSVEDTVRVFIRSAGGVIGSIDLSWTIDKRQPYYLSIYGSEGTIHVGWKDSKYCRASDGEWIAFGSGYSKLGAFCRQIDNFVGCVRREQQPVIKPEDAVASVEAIEAAYAALESSHWVPVHHEHRAGHRRSKVSLLSGSN
jgi:predicted dehydrogenase